MFEMEASPTAPRLSSRTLTSFFRVIMGNRNGMPELSGNLCRILRKGIWEEELGRCTFFVSAVAHAVGRKQIYGNEAVSICEQAAVRPSSQQRHWSRMRLAIGFRPFPAFASILFHSRRRSWAPASRSPPSSPTTSSSSSAAASTRTSLAAASGSALLLLFLPLPLQAQWSVCRTRPPSTPPTASPPSPPTRVRLLSGEPLLIPPLVCRQVRGAGLVAESGGPGGELAL